ncbi:Microtubule-associated protein TORTIFOLIA1 [Linum perenne]
MVLLVVLLFKIFLPGFVKFSMDIISMPKSALLGVAASLSQVALKQKVLNSLSKLADLDTYQIAVKDLDFIAQSLSLSDLQVGAIAPRCWEPLLQNIHECLTSTDWATRKAGADALSALAVHSCSLVSAEAADSTLTALEACRFDKVTSLDILFFLLHSSQMQQIKPVRDSMNEALQLWKKIAGKEDGGVSDDQKASPLGGETRDITKLSNKNVNTTDTRVELPMKYPPDGSSSTMDSASKAKVGNTSEKAVVILKKKPLVLTNKELNPDFFQNLEKGSGELLVEVFVPHRCINSSNLNNEEESIGNNIETRRRSDKSANNNSDDLQFDKNGCINDRGITGRDSRRRAFDEQTDFNSRETTGNHASLTKADEQPEVSLGNSRGNWLAIHRQLLQLERQQTHLMHMLQDFMGESHDNIVTLENRVRGLEIVMEDMARDLTTSSDRRVGSFSMGFEGSSSKRILGKYNGFSDYSSAKYSGGGPFGDRYEQYDVTTSVDAKGRNLDWRANTSDTWDFSLYDCSRYSQVGSKRAPDGGPLWSPKFEHENDQVSSRKGWDKGGRPSRFGEGPSARSV